ncbi:MAG: DNA primase catalytic subunit PriS, partial [Thermoplasmata archaeon]|nr:DNA primase catalytic subunit PriS [Thermoplasmata archaeon]NIS14328.1 DNA primase catalytic subunit PriS [Thermoplasmata archaeon]NIS22150.1 DNA primase catalytic subunit PriS [Thermoplasmata archaeon]NIT80030.1 DNA primase catalytic subunit PriS [Thermoplasmata archaeon]NIU51168.1 DNA primase catalytic subunit PriS [Thermoplasmata archaeon]
QDYLKRDVPRHAYYSTAYYEDPGARTMNEKGWQGATLVFDLDADHLEGAHEMEYGQMLEAVKVEFVKLVDRWLIGKLGFDERDVGIAFSGGRGYHAHIEDPRVLELNAFERREIVDLVTGKADTDDFLEKEAFHSGMRQDGRGYSRHTLRMPDPARGDWKGDLTRETLTYFQDLDAMQAEGREDEAVRRLAALGEVEEDEARDLLHLLVDGEPGNRRLDRMVSDQIIDLREGIGERFWERIAGKLFVQMAGEADEPVTADTKRLIRLPTSLHGKTGFRVVELNRDQLEGFDPLTDALAFGKDPVDVVGLVDDTFQLGGEEHAVAHERRSTLPEYAAVFAFLRGMAQLAD